MNKNATPHELLRLLYQETGSEEKRHLELEMLRNPRLHEEYLQLLASKEMLRTEAFEPSPTSLQIILEHSRSRSFQPLPPSAV